MRDDANMDILTDAMGDSGVDTYNISQLSIADTSKFLHHHESSTKLMYVSNSQPPKIMSMADSNISNFTLSYSTTGEEFYRTKTTSYRDNSYREMVPKQVVNSRKRKPDHSILPQ